jgi:GNAT superfamily N-acetyltransferase
MSSAIVSGRKIRFRLLERDDEGLIRSFYNRLSPDTVYSRFMGPVVPPADALIQSLIDVDHCDRDALVALDERGVAGIARYAVLPGRKAYEVAIVIADDWQRRGLGGMLMRRLGHIARLRGIVSFHATILGDNRRAQAFIRGLSTRTTMRFESGVIEADIPLRPPRIA